MSEDREIKLLKHWGTEAEVLLSFPENFVFRYEQVWLAGLPRERQGGEFIGMAVAKRTTRLSTSQTETRGGAKEGKKHAGAAERDMLGNQAARAFKRKIDADLRKVNRRMKAWIDGGAESEVGATLGRRCTMCKRWGEESWVWCPWDRGAMEDIAP